MCIKIINKGIVQENNENEFYWRESDYSNTNQAFLNLNFKSKYLIEFEEDEFGNISKIL